MSLLRSIALAGVVLIVACLLITVQRNQVIALRGEVAIEAKAKQEALDANAESQATISTLRAEAARNEAYRLDLDTRLKVSEQKADQARKDFDELKRTSKPVRDWADVPLPDGLRSKAPVSNKDKRGSR